MPCAAWRPLCAGAIIPPGGRRCLPGISGRFAMKNLALLSALWISTAALPAYAEVLMGSDVPDRPANNVIRIYNTNPAEQCFRAAQDGLDLKFGLEHCNTAMRNPLTIY